MEKFPSQEGCPEGTGCVTLERGVDVLITGSFPFLDLKLRVLYSDYRLD